MISIIKKTSIISKKCSVLMDLFMIELVKSRNVETFFWWSVKQKHHYFDRVIHQSHLVPFHLMMDHHHQLYRKFRNPQGHSHWKM
ncbi:unnamed protein product [Onchocerca flexuosa]|uniref:Ovule protein n=1 Tax=Onchocerca flexuosa TaxID=387005 RepID=A0A183HG34_9BILA|nr:unnamed protein product [Onchocerca flexuosa]